MPPWHVLSAEEEPTSGIQVHLLPQVWILEGTVERDVTSALWEERLGPWLLAATQPMGGSQGRLWKELLVTM